MRRLAALSVLLCLVRPAAADAKPSHEELVKLMAETDVIAKTVSQIRGLPLKKRIERDVLSQAEIRKRLVERLASDYGPAELAAEETALKRLGLLPATMDYKQEMIDLLTEQIAGFYDPTVKELYIADWIDPTMQRMVMAHEIDHALQDQRFDLDRFVKVDRENGDALAARQALVEGDGVALMIEFMMREMGNKVDPWADDTMVNAMAAATGLAGTPEFDKAPLILKETLLFPYREGLRLVASSRRTHPWSDVDAMFARPPASTEQVIHPEKYRANERPIGVKSLPLPALKNAKPRYVNVLGEMLFRVILQQHGVARERAERAAAGWGGDRLVIYDAPAGSLAIDLSVWDAEADAVEAADALIEALPSLAGATPDGYTEKGSIFASAAGADGTLSIVERKGTKILLLVGAPAELADKIRADVWSRWKFREA
jgi:hypothetical protein